MGQMPHITKKVTFSMRTKNTEMMADILNFINDYKCANGISPTTREIEQHLNIPKSTVARYLSTLRKQGKIEYKGGRTIIDRNIDEETRLAPVLGSVSCGPLKLAEERHEQYIRLPASLFGSGELFVLEADGMSMIDIGIAPGDLVVIRRQNICDNGKVAVVLVENEATLKRVYFEKDRIRLHPENKNMNDMYADNCIILGVAIKILKDIV